MSLQPVFTHRDLTTALEFPSVLFTTDRFSFTTIGGPLAATVKATGSYESLFDLANSLRCGVKLYDEDGIACWWGYVHTITINAGMNQFVLSLDTMKNRVAAVFEMLESYTETAGTRATTDWAVNADSVAEFGTKELLAQINSATLEIANIKRDVALEAFKYPSVLITPASGGDLSAEFECHGFFDTLDWVYYAHDPGEAIFATSDPAGVQVQAVGSAEGNELAAQSFQIQTGESWNGAVLAVNARIQGSPADNLTLKLYSDVASAPGVLLSDSTAPAAAITSTFKSVYFALSDVILMVPSTTYWLVVGRSGAIDGSNYFEVEVNEGLGADGVLRLWNGSAWVARGTDADMLYQASGVQETTTQMATLVDEAGQFFTDSEITNVSGLTAPLYQNGDSTALTVLKNFLAGGTAAGKRLLADVTVDRVLRVYIEPAYSASTVQVFHTANGQLTDAYDNKLLARECPVAKWGALKGVIPPMLEVSRLIDPSRFFVDEAEYSTADKAWKATRTRGATMPWDMAQEG